MGHAGSESSLRFRLKTYLESEEVNTVLTTESPVAGETEIREWNSKARIIQGIPDKALAYMNKEIIPSKIMKALECLFAQKDIRI